MADVQEKNYWKGRTLHSLLLVTVLAVPLAIGLWIAYTIVHQAGQMLYGVIMLIMNTGDISSVTVIGAVVTEPVQSSVSLSGALFAILIFSLTAWLIELKTKNRIFWWYPALVALFELSKSLRLIGLEAFFIGLMAILTVIIAFDLLRRK